MKSLLLILLIVSTAQAAETSTLSATETDTHPYNQTFSLQAGKYHPNAISISNSNAKYDYSGNTLDSYLIEPGISMKLFHFLGAVSIEENLAISTFKGGLSSDGSALSLFTMGADTRLKHSWEWFPLRALIPYIEGGYQYTFYSQNGSSDLEAAQGSIGNFVAGAGFDIWLNEMFSPSHDHVNKYGSVPLFLTTKLNHVFSTGSDVDLGSTSVLVGLSIGI